MLIAYGIYLISLHSFYRQQADCAARKNEEETAIIDRRWPREKKSDAVAKLQELNKERWSVAEYRLWAEAIVSLLSIKN